MKTTLLHNGFIGSFEVSIEDNILFGEILHINDLVTYEASTPDELKRSFIEAVEDYIATCAQLGKEPNKPFSGTFNVRIGADLHKQLGYFATEHNKKINEVVKDAIDCHINGKHQHIHHHYQDDRADYSGEFRISEPTHAPRRVQLTVVR